MIFTQKEDKSKDEKRWEGKIIVERRIGGEKLTWEENKIREKTRGKWMQMKRRGKTRGKWRKWREEKWQERRGWQKTREKGKEMKTSEKTGRLKKGKKGKS